MTSLTTKTASQSSLSPFFDIPLNDHADHNKLAPKSCRYIFRGLTIVMLAFICTISIVILTETLTQTDTCARSDSVNTQIIKVNRLADLISSLISEVNQISTVAAVNLPLKLDQYAKSITDQVTQLIRQCNAACRGPGENPGIQNYAAPARFNQTTWADLNQTLKNIEFDSGIPVIVPQPTNLLSCTRYPSYSESEGIWCYSHVELDNSCEPSNSDLVVVKYGTIQITKEGLYQRQVMGLYSKRFSYPKRSCSIAASPSGCYLLCSSASKPESEEYQSYPASQMSILFIGFNTKIVDYQDIVLDGLEVWTAVYPGIGAGIIHYGFLVFPVYGGVLINQPLGSELRNITLNLPPVRPTCKEDLKTGVYSTKDVLSAPYYKDNIVINGYLACYLLGPVPTHCSLKPLPQGNLSLGAESQFYHINGLVYMYQRGSGWYPYTQVYRLVLRAQGTKLIVRSVVRILIESTSRPGYQNCSILDNCPYPCVTGVFQAPWLLSTGSKWGVPSSDLIFTQAWSRDFYTRQKATFSICNRNTCTKSISMGNETYYLGYSTTACSQNPTTNTVICRVFGEWSNNPKRSITVRESSYKLSFN